MAVTVFWLRSDVPFLLPTQYEKRDRSRPRRIRFQSSTRDAVEVHVFEESLRGTGEGHYPWDLMPNSTMTNGAVAQQVQKVEELYRSNTRTARKQLSFRRTRKS